jgi:aromatic ring-cleaving dioxygenase
VYVSSSSSETLYRLIDNVKIVPELRIYKVWDKPIGPHPLAMFEVNLFTPGTLVIIMLVWKLAKCLDRAIRCVYSVAGN